MSNHSKSKEITNKQFKINIYYFFHLHVIPEIKYSHIKYIPCNKKIIEENEISKNDE